VTNVSGHGFWLLIHDEEHFLPFDKFPWFREAPIAKLIHVELPSEQHLYWPELDVDLELESILHPERYPLMSKVHEAGTGYAAVNYDQAKIDDTVLALLQLTLHEGGRACKRFDFDVMDRLHEQGYILDPKGRSKSVSLTKKGLERSRKLFEELFGEK
jgi:hypothetical protein